MRFFTLIHIEKDEKSIHNNAFATSFKSQIGLYFSCAKQLHLSLKSVGIELIIITNDKAYLDALNDGYEIEILQQTFSLKVPSGLKFYSAHFKIELYNYLSTLTDKYIALVDCDIVCVNKMPASFINCISKELPLYYDITNQIAPAVGADRIISDKERLSKTTSIGLWAGGEFLAGPPAFFKRVYNEIEAIKETYFSNFNSFSHQGDEMLTSVAIENLMIKRGVAIVDAGHLSIIGRYWSPKTSHVQSPITAYTNHFLLHLPSDKKFITRLKKSELKEASFFRNYRPHLVRSRILENAISGLKPYLKKGKAAVKK